MRHHVSARGARARSLCAFSRFRLVIIGIHGAEMLGDRAEKRWLLRWGIVPRPERMGVVVRARDLVAGAERGEDL